ncbi:MAG: hypothetical protein LBH24_04735 [Clostridiales bacterium]|jgi:rubrerythrin|nr:hypothetical protein [Clostridiales bacterium]
MNLEDTQTLKNLARAFATETQDGARYQFLKQQAIQQQLNYAANTLKLLATNEMAHAKLWWSLITENDKVSHKNIEIKAGFPYETGEFVDQIGIVADVEDREGSRIYVDFAKTARKEGLADIAEKFDMVASVELQHSAILTQLYKGLKDGALYKSQQAVEWKCTKCGYIGTAKTAWKTCPVCMMPQGFAEGQIPLK